MEVEQLSKCTWLFSGRDSNDDEDDEDDDDDDDDDDDEDEAADVHID